MSALSRTLSRIFRRTPSLRTRVALATAIGAAIVVVPEEERTIVFEKFSRGTTASHSGSGLGPCPGSPTG